MRKKFLVLALAIVLAVSIPAVFAILSSQTTIPGEGTIKIPSNATPTPTPTVKPSATSTNGDVLAYTITNMDGKDASTAGIKWTSPWVPGDHNPRGRSKNH